MVDKQKHLNLSKWLDFIASCKIKKKNIEFNDKNKAGVTGDFNGREYDIILENINILRDFPTLEKNEQIQRLWKSFQSILQQIRAGSSEHIAVDIDEWHALYVSIYRETNQTPYIHACHKHVAEQMIEHGDISIFDRRLRN